MNNNDIADNNRQGLIFYEKLTLITLKVEWSIYFGFGFKAT